VGAGAGQTPGPRQPRLRGRAPGLAVAWPSNGAHGAHGRLLVHRQRLSWL